MQRVVRWNIDFLVKSAWKMPHGTWNDLDQGHVAYFDVDAEQLAKVSPALREALTRNGQLGQIVDHTYSVVGGNRIMTFVVEFR
ncbi:hypothetical protein ACFP2T_36820 [Plantactinospora solaniradicis]|uniref:Uncharacterized protein n=1 Tax=Plantactinospora solaniradicis TaxID=1723736 RepID=A0ABW1KIW7_9ACTN